MKNLQNFFPYSRFKRGFTLTELAVVMGIVGVVLGAVWIAAGNVSNSRKAAQAITELRYINQGIINLYGQNATFSGSLNTGPAGSCGLYYNAVGYLMNEGVIPPEMVTSSTTAQNPWGQPFAVYLGPPAPSTKTYRISFYCVPNDGCVKLLLQATGCTANTVGCPVAVYTALSGSSATPSATTGWGGFTLATAQALCAANTSTSGSVEFDYRFQ